MFGKWPFGWLALWGVITVVSGLGASPSGCPFSVLSSDGRASIECIQQKEKV